MKVGTKKTPQPLDIPPPSASVMAGNHNPVKPGASGKDFKWMGFKSHVMATLAQWRDEDYHTDTVFHCIDGQVFAHRLILAAASPLLKEVMNQDLNEQVVIFVPEVPKGVIQAILDLLYKGRMNITPSNTYAIRSLVQVLKISAEDVSVITGAKKLQQNIPPVAQTSKNNTSEKSIEEQENNHHRPSRKRKAESANISLNEGKMAAKIAKNQNETAINSKGRNKSKKQKVKKGDSSLNSDLETSGFHDLEDVETWVCAICQCYDPIITSPVKNPQQNALLVTTEWIGCDCNRWYHKYCTKLKKIDESFSCKQLDRECLPM